MRLIDKISRRGRPLALRLLDGTDAQKTIPGPVRSIIHIALMHPDAEQLGSANGWLGGAPEGIVAAQELYLACLTCQRSGLCAPPCPVYGRQVRAEVANNPTVMTLPRCCFFNQPARHPISLAWGKEIAGLNSLLS